MSLPSPGASTGPWAQAERRLAAGLRWGRSAAAPATCGAEKLVPSATMKLSAAYSGSVEEMICEPGAMTSGLSA